MIPDLKIVAYQSSKFCIYIPESMMLKDGNVYLIREKNAKTNYQIDSDTRDSLIKNKSYVLAPEPLSSYDENLWCAVEDDPSITHTFILSHENEWRAKFSRGLINRFSNAKSDPYQKLKVFEAAGNLVSVDAVSLFKTFSKLSLPNETLDETFERLKRESKNA